MRRILGMVLAVGLLSACGGVEEDMNTDTLGQQEQNAEACQPGYTANPTWECENGCNVLYRYCCPNSGQGDCYNAGVQLVRCGGACY
jgi:hypothetical protein